MAFYDVGTGDLRELWESYLSEPVSDHRLLTNLSSLEENEKERGERTSRGDFCRRNFIGKFHFRNVALANPLLALHA